MPSTAPKTTTPTPSLNRASPAKMAWKVGGRPRRRNRPTTETGSVGARMAPSTRHQMRATGTPSVRKTSQMPPPKTATAISTPKVASARTVHLRRSSSAMSTCMLPAKSRKASAPFMSVAGRLMVVSSLSARLRKLKGASQGSSAIRMTETTSATISTPVEACTRSRR
jgi:hypothetical protein